MPRPLDRAAGAALAGVLASALVAVAAPSAHAGPATGLPGARSTGPVVTARIPSGPFAQGSKALVTGTAPGGAARTVVVQDRGANGTWVPLATARTRADGSFAVNAPTWWVARQTLRVYAPATATLAAAVSGTATMTVTRTYRPQGTARSALTATAPRARWNPCQVLTWRLNPHLMWKGARRTIARAFAQVSAATGLRFGYGGTTTVVPLKGPDPAHVPLNPPHTSFVIGWSTPRVVPGLSGPIVGLGTAGSYSWIGDPGPDDWVGYDDQGQVVFDATARLSRAERLDLALHEIGHAIGLGHVADRRLIMNPVLSRVPLGHYGVGDLRGLARLGAGNGCIFDEFAARAARVPVRRSPPLS